MNADAYVAPDFQSSTLITIDTQRDVLDGQPMEVPGTTAALPSMQRLLTAFRSAARPIVHIVRLYRADGSNADLCRRRAVESGHRILTPGSDGAELAPALLPEPSVRLDPDLLLANGVQKVADNEVAIYKPRWGAFFETPLEAHLRALEVSTVVFCGCNYPNCPRTSIYEASERDFRVVLATDAISGLYERGSDELRRFGVQLMASEEVAARLAAELSVTT